MAPRGSQFPALTQRIIDDGIIIVAATDEQINEVVAIFWLYLTKDLKLGRCYLVANFTEMRESISLHDPILQKAILAQLLAFTHQFANALNVTFVLGPLRYGNLPNWDFVAHFYQFEKIGAIRLSPDHDEYYLNSLMEEEFYEYHPQMANNIYAQGIKQITLLESAPKITEEPLSLKKMGLFAGNASISEKKPYTSNALAYGI